MKRLLAILLLAAPLHAQVTYVAGHKYGPNASRPGSCTSGDLWLTSDTSTLYGCVLGSWVAAGGGGAPSGTGYVHVTGGAYDTPSATVPAASVSGLATIATSGSASDLGTGTVPIGRIPTGSSSSTVTIGNDSRLSDSRAASSIPDATPAAGSVLVAASTAPATPAAGKASVYVDSTSKALASKNDAGTVSHTVQSKASTSHQFLTAIADDGTVSAAQPAAGDVSGLATVATSGSASDLGTGTLPAGRLPNPGASSLGGVNSKASASHQFLTQIGTDGSVSQAQPAESDLSFTNITTGNVSTAAHGFAPILPNDGTRYLDGTGSYTVPAGTSGGGGAATSIPDGTPALGSILTTAIAAPSTPASGKASVYVDSTSKALAVINDAGAVSHSVQSKASTSHQFLTAISDAGVVSAAQPAASDVSGLAASATTDTTVATNITSGTLPAAQLPNPSSTTLGGVQSKAAVSHQWITSISTSGVPAQAQPAESDISFSDITTNNVSTSTHGFAPKAPNVATQYLDGTGAWTVPAGAGASTALSNLASVAINAALATGAGTTAALTATAPAAITTTQAGIPVNLTASDAVAGSSVSGAAAGGAINLAAGAAAQKTSGNANGGDIVATGGARVGTGRRGTFSAPGAGATSEAFGLASIASGTSSVAVGYLASATGTGATAVGPSANAASGGFGSVAVGYSAAAAETGVAIGTSCAATGSDRQTAIGYGASATGAKGLALGSGATSAYQGAIALGAYTATTAANQLVCGNNAASSVYVLDSYWGSGVTDATSPQAHTFHATGGSGTDKAAGSLVLQPGLGTGTGASGDAYVKTGVPRATGSTAQSPTVRQSIRAKQTTLTESTATTVVTIPVAASKIVGGRLLYTVSANDGTDFQSTTGQILFSAVDKAGTVTTAITLLGGAETSAASSGTLSSTWTAVASTTNVILKCNAVSSLTQTVLEVHSQLLLNGDDVTGTVTWN